MWAFGLIAAYSLIAYKTPWLILNFVVPLAIVAGYAIEAIYRMDSNRLRFPIAVMALAVIVGAYQTIDLNFFNYDNDATYYVYVYAHTKRDTIKLVEEVEKLAQQNPQKKQTGITIVSPDYWPLPWYLRNYSRVGYFARMTQSSEPIIIASESQRAEMDTNFGELYQLVPSGASDEGYELRPGVNLLLYKRKTMLAGQP
jgi:predicted membrane-bound mannosyltransferase